MSDLLAIIDEADTAKKVLQDIACHQPGSVTILLKLHEETDWALDESDRGRTLRDRLAWLLTSVEQLTGAVVLGIAGTRDQIRGLSFDAVVEGRSLLPA